MTDEHVETMTSAMFHGQMELMKDTLDRGLMIYQGDRANRGYRQFKQETMRTFHTFMDGFWGTLLKGGLVERCKCGAPTRRWSDCPLCGGAGFVAVEEAPSGIHEGTG